LVTATKPEKGARVTALIRAEGLSYSAGKTVLLDGIDLEVDVGEVVAVIGPNGAGKSTLLRLLAGDLKPDAGRAYIGGVDIADGDVGGLAQLRAVLPQHRVADIPFTAYEVVAMGRHPHRRSQGNTSSADVAAIDDAMKRTATTSFAGRVFSTLSGGEQARVSLARVLAQQTPVLLLDEPTAALDIAHEERLMGELESRANAGASVLAILHDLNAAARHASRIVALARGRIAISGPPAIVLTNVALTDIYEHPMVVVPHPFRDCPLVLPADAVSPHSMIV
jgi:iron complex transport system ATP-binding protein